MSNESKCMKISYFSHFINYLIIKPLFYSYFTLHYLTFKASKVFNFKHEFWTNGKRHFKTLNIKKKEIDFRKPESNWNLIDIKVKEKKNYYR